MLLRTAVAWIRWCAESALNLRNVEKINGAVRGAAGGNTNLLKLCCRLHVCAERVTVETGILTNRWPAHLARRRAEPWFKQSIMWFNYLLFTRYANRVEARRGEAFASKARFGHFRKIFLKQILIGVVSWKMADPVPCIVSVTYIILGC